jgi:hypothetical protein
MAGPGKAPFRRRTIAETRLVERFLHYLSGRACSQVYRDCSTAPCARLQSFAAQGFERQAKNSRAGFQGPETARATFQQCNVSRWPLPR